MVGGESLGSTTKKFPINLAEEKAKTGLSGLKSTVTKQTNATPIPETLVKPRSTPVSDTKVDKEPIISKSKDIPKKTIGKTEPSIIDNANKNPLRIESFNKDEIKPILDTINRYSVKSPQEFERIIKDYVMKYKNRIELLDHQKDFLQALRNPLFSKNSPDEIYNLVKQTDTKVNPFDLSKNKKGMISPKAIGESVGIGKVPDGTMKSP